MRTRTIRWPQERPAVIEHIRAVHGAHDSDVLGNWYGTMPEFSPDECFVIDADITDPNTIDVGTTEDEASTIAAHTMLIPRYLQIGESVVQAAEVGIVGTLETYRRRGYAHALMGRAIERMGERGDALGILFGIPNFYEQWDYEYGIGSYLTNYESSIATELALKARNWKSGNGHDRRTMARLGISGKPITVRPFDLNDLPTIMELYTRDAAQGRSIIARNEEIWRWQLDYLASIGRADSGSFLVAEYQDNVVAYLRMVTTQPVNWFRTDATSFSIIEYVGSDADAADALLAEVAICARDYGADQIGLYIHPQSSLMDHAMAHGAVQRSFTGPGYVRLNDLALTLESLETTLQNRLENTVFARNKIQLQLSTEMQSAAITIGDPSGREEVVELESPATDLVRLFTGWFGLSHLVEGSYLRKHEDLLTVLFPKGDPKVGFADLI